MKTPEINFPAGVIARFSETPDHTATDLAETVADVLKTRLQKAGRASLAVSGGSTPLPFFKSLSERRLDWSRVDVLLADERWVDEADEASNTRLVKEHLLQGNATNARYLSIKQPGATPLHGLHAATCELQKLARPLDVLILGMGNDGHTASLFPDAPELAHAMDPAGRAIVASMTPPSQAHKRITLTWSFMSDAGFVALHLKGKDKLDTLERALADINDTSAMPIRNFLRPGLHVFWSP